MHHLLCIIRTAKDKSGSECESIVLVGYRIQAGSTAVCTVNRDQEGHFTFLCVLWCWFRVVACRFATARAARALRAFYEYLTSFLISSFYFKKGIINEVIFQVFVKCFVPVIMSEMKCGILLCLVFLLSMDLGKY